MTEQVIWKVIGCMTGTSCDGLNLAYIETNGVDIIKYGSSETIQFDDHFRSVLRQRVSLNAAFHPHDKTLAKDISSFHGDQLTKFIKKHKLQIDAIGFHGQTVWHDPSNQLSIQLGDCQDLANIMGVKVVGAFRQDDLKNGGQGAPLVPVYHRAISNPLEKPVVCLNIGGVANITYIGPDSELIAGDTGPGNALIDDWVRQHTGLFHDAEGSYAAKGTVHWDLVNKWLQDPYFLKPFPKSLDRMHFHRVLDDCKDITVEDGAASLTQFTVETVVRAIQTMPMTIKKLIVCGGGWYNKTMISGLQRYFPNLVSARDIGLDTNAIEAQLIGYLTVRYFNDLPSTFTSTTGVKVPTVAGKLFTPNNGWNINLTIVLSLGIPMAAVIWLICIDIIDSSLILFHDDMVFL